LPRSPRADERVTIELAAAVLVDVSDGATFEWIVVLQQNRSRRCQKHGTADRDGDRSPTAKRTEVRSSIATSRGRLRIGGRRTRGSRSVGGAHQGTRWCLSRRPASEMG